MRDSVEMMDSDQTRSFRKASLIPTFCVPEQIKATPTPYTMPPQVTFYVTLTIYYKSNTPHWNSL